MSNGDAGQTNLVLMQRIYDRRVLKVMAGVASPYVYVTIKEVPQDKWGLARGPLPLPGSTHQRSRAELGGCRRCAFASQRRAAARPRESRHVTEFRWRRAHLNPA